MAERILILGGAGNLACQLSFDLIDAGYDVVLADITAPIAPVADGCGFCRCDITNSAELCDLLMQVRPQSILHFASLLSGKSEQDRGAAWQVNMNGAFNVFEAALQFGVRQIIFPSSLAAFGGELPSNVSEEQATWPTGFYGVTKAAIETLGNYYHQQHGLDFRCIRLPIVVSEHAPAGAASAYVSRAFLESAQTGSFTFQVRPTTSPAVIYVQDVLRAICLLLAADEQQLTRRVYNLYAMSPQAQDVARVVCQNVPNASVRFEPDDALTQLIESWPSLIEDTSARTDWGWEPMFTLDEMASDFSRKLGVLVT